MQANNHAGLPGCVYHMIHLINDLHSFNTSTVTLDSNPLKCICIHLGSCCLVLSKLELYGHFFQDGKSSLPDP